MNLTLNIVDRNNSPLIIDSGGISINTTSSTSNSSSLTTTLDNFSEAVITVNQTGYYPYDIILDSVYEDNQSITITLVDIIIDINDINFAKPVPKFFTINSPCGLRVDYYLSSSFPGVPTWYLNNEYFTEGVKGSIETCNAQELQLKIRNVTYRTINSISYCPITQIVWDLQYANILTGNTIAGVIDPLDTYLALDTTTNITIVDIRPSILIELSSTKDQLQSECCYTKGELIKVTPVVDITTLTKNDYTLKYTVTGPNGNIPIESLEMSLADDLVREFRLSDLGSYTIRIEVTNVNCSIVYFKEITIETCNYISISYNECSQYTIANKSSYRDVTVTIDDILDNNLIVRENLKAGFNLNVTLPEIYLYFITIEYYVDNVLKQEIYVINNYCLLEECLTSYLEDLLCGETIRCKDCPDPIELNRFLLLLFTFNMKLNSEFGTNNFYNLLTESKFEEMMSIQNTIDKIKEYCKRIGCESNLTKGFTYSCYTGPIDLGRSYPTSGCKTCK